MKRNILVLLALMASGIVYANSPVKGEVAHPIYGHKFTFE